MNMVLYFNKKDLIKFGNYLLSDERKELIFSHPDKSIEGKEEALKTVSHADFENFLEKKKNKKS